MHDRRPYGAVMHLLEHEGAYLGPLMLLGSSESRGRCLVFVALLTKAKLMREKPEYLPGGEGGEGIASA